MIFLSIGIVKLSPYLPRVGPYRIIKATIKIISNMSDLKDCGEMTPGHFGQIVRESFTKFHNLEWCVGSLRLTI